MSLKFAYPFLAVSLIIKPVFAKHGYGPNWNEVLPEIAKEFLPEETREKVDKIFPPQEDTSRKKTKHKNGADEYYGDTKLKGKLSSPIRIYGTGTLKNVRTKEDIEIKGGATIEDSHVSSAHVDGSLQGKDSTFESLKTRGSATLHNSNILQHATIHGRLTAYKTKFHGPLHVSGTPLTLKSSKTHDIKLMSESKSQTVFLEDTEVKGDIIFENEPGAVILKKNSHIHGKVKNGKIRAE